FRRKQMRSLTAHAAGSFRVRIVRAERLQQSLERRLLSALPPRNTGCDLWVPEKRLSLTESGPRVKPIVDRSQSRLEHMCVDLCRRQVGVAQHHLDGPQIGAVLEQMS